MNTPPAISCLLVHYYALHRSSFFREWHHFSPLLSFCALSPYLPKNRSKSRYLLFAFFPRFMYITTLVAVLPPLRSYGVIFDPRILFEIHQKTFFKTSFFTNAMLKNPSPMLTAFKAISGRQVIGMPRSILKRMVCLCVCSFFV